MYRVCISKQCGTKNCYVRKILQCWENLLPLTPGCRMGIVKDSAATKSTGLQKQSKINENNRTHTKVWWMFGSELHSKLMTRNNYWNRTKVAPHERLDLAVFGEKLENRWTNHDCNLKDNRQENEWLNELLRSWKFVIVIEWRNVCNSLKRMAPVSISKRHNLNALRNCNCNYLKIYTFSRVGNLRIGLIIMEPNWEIQI